jgi:hypothetical protein
MIGTGQLGAVHFWEDSIGDTETSSYPVIIMLPSIYLGLPSCLLLNFKNTVPVEV